MAGSIPGLAQWVAVSCDVGRRRSLYLVLLRLWCRPAAVALIQPLAWEPPYAAGEALEDTKRQKTKNKKNPRSSCRGAVQTNLTRNQEVAGSIPGLAQ